MLLKRTTEFKAVDITVEWRESKPAGQTQATIDWEVPKILDDLGFSVWTGKVTSPH